MLHRFDRTSSSPFSVSRNVEHPFLLFFSLAHIHAPLFISPAFAGKSRHGRYGDNMEEVDWLIGEKEASNSPFVEPWDRIVPTVHI